MQSSTSSVSRLIIKGRPGEAIEEVAPSTTTFSTFLQHRFMKSDVLMLKEEKLLNEFEKFQVRVTIIILRLKYMRAIINTQLSNSEFIKKEVITIITNAERI